MLTENALNGFRNYVKRTISKAKYKCSGNYSDATITDISIASDGEIVIDLMLDPPATSGPVLITTVQLYDTSGSVWLETAANVEKESNRKGVFYRVTIDIYEA